MGELDLELEGGGVILAGREVRMTVAEVVVCPCESVVVIKAVTRLLDWVMDKREGTLLDDMRTIEDNTTVLPALSVVVLNEADPRKTSE